MQKRLLTAALLALSSVAAAQGNSLLYLGPVGTYSDQVAQQVAGSRGWGTTLASSITDVSTQVSEGKSRYGLIPIENSLGGYVAETLTLLGKTPAWRVIAVADLPIDNTLLVNAGTRLSDITTIISHPQPFLQSANYLKTTFPNAKRVEVKSTAAAAEMVAKDGGKTMAAISAPAAAKVYGLTALAERIQDNKTNTTRFLVVQNGELNAVARVKHTVISYQARAGDNGLGLTVLMDNLQALGFNVTGVLSAPAGTLGEQHLTLFAEGKVERSVTELRGAAARTVGAATVIGAY